LNETYFWRQRHTGIGSRRKLPYCALDGPSKKHLNLHSGGAVSTGRQDWRGLQRKGGQFYGIFGRKSGACGNYVSKWGRNRKGRSTEIIVVQEEGDQSGLFFSQRAFGKEGGKKRRNRAATGGEGTGDNPMGKEKHKKKRLHWEGKNQNILTMLIGQVGNALNRRGDLSKSNAGRRVRMQGLSQSKTT